MSLLSLSARALKPFSPWPLLLTLLWAQAAFHQLKGRSEQVRGVDVTTRGLSRIHWGDMDRSLSEQGLLEAGLQHHQAEPQPSAPAAAQLPAPIPAAAQIAMMQLHPQGLVPVATQYPTNHSYPQVPPPQYDPLAVAALSLNTSSVQLTSASGKKFTQLWPPSSIYIHSHSLLFFQLSCLLIN